jgi:hypothetical protein
LLTGTPRRNPTVVPAAKAWPHSTFVVVRGARLVGEDDASTADVDGICVDYADWETGCCFHLYPRELRTREPFALEEVSVVGRVDERGACVGWSEGAQAYVSCRILEGASRLTGTSIAGLVVGAMGCFIFGLYLRRWLIDRKALASQPGQDMIA